jgi:uncharacterized membrane protein YkvA (DUF1232 family)
MLFQLVERVCRTIDGLPMAPDPELSRQIRAAAPDAVSQLIGENRRAKKPMNEDSAAQVLALGAHTMIKSIPRSARAMVAKINNRRVDSGQRCAMASILAYLVQPHDLIPDDAPGNYGFIDDAALLQAGLVEYLDTLPAGTDAGAQARIANFLVALTPAQVRGQIQLGVSSMSQMLQMLQMIGPEMADGILQMIVANPLAQPAGFSAPSGFTPHAARSYGQGFFGRSGAYIEGDNIMMGGGGPSLIGQLFIPS